MILVYAGRRAQSLPESGVAVAPRLKRLLAALRPRAIVGAAADGGDILVLEAALSGPAPTFAHVVLPTPHDVFVQASVEEDWRLRHRQVVDRVMELGGEVESLGESDGEEAYRAANLRMLQVAEHLRGAGSQPDERVVALVVAAEGEGAMITDLTAAAQLRNVAVLRIDPAVDQRTRPSCFVAMPYGRKLDVQRSVELDCELLYGKVLVPALEHAQMRYRRADEEIDSGVVLIPMLEWLAQSDLVVGDLATSNFNVGWELGLRHLLRSSKTLLMLPAGTIPPFDVSALRHVEYSIDETGISDAAAIAAWKALQPHLANVTDGGTDSPVAAVMDVQAWARIETRGQRDERFEELRERLALARDLGDADAMRVIADDARGLSAEAVKLISAEAGVGLVRLRCYTEAAELLRPLVEADRHVSRPEAHMYYAQALYRPEEANVEDYDEAEAVLAAVLLARPGHPEVWAALGAVAKRRSRRRRARARQEDDIRLAFRAYAHDYERDLDLFYEGINLVACGVVLELVHGDIAAGAQARRVVGAVRLAAELKLERDPRNFWAAVTAPEAALHAYLLGSSPTAEEAIHGYARARAMSPTAGDLHSSLGQFDWLTEVGVDDQAIDASRRALGGRGN
jgi:tetratricopeptide (TPR) repeat protein